MNSNFNSDDDSFQDSFSEQFANELSHLSEATQPDEDTLGESSDGLYEQILNLHRHGGPDNTVQDGPSFQSNFLTSMDSRNSSAFNGLRSSAGTATPHVKLPRIGEEISGFRLLAEIGSGAFARVFLAQQGNLASRQVVLKVSLIEGTEPQTLAQLQHTHVVPIYSVHDDIRSGLRVVCMPYFGGATLAKVMTKIWDDREMPVSGRTLIEALDEVSGPKSEAAGVARPLEAPQETHLHQTRLQTSHSARTALAHLTYVRAVVWIAGRLAEGLHHSHERNVVHRDIKPSNILISAEALPLLLDFNVSQAVDCNLEDATLGGTIAYMAPEQLRAVLRRDIVSLACITHQSDIYSLGLVLYEMLSGPRPFAETPVRAASNEQLKTLLALRERVVPSLKEKHLLDIPWSLESIVRKCLAPEPHNRYASAAQLAADLDCFLEDLPLKHAPELSTVEQVRKWTRRHPKWTTAMMVVSLVMTTVVAPGALLLEMTRKKTVIQADLIAESKAKDLASEFQVNARRSLCLVNTVIPNQDTLALGMKKCHETLAIFEVESNPAWQNGDYWQRLDEQQRTPLAESIRELLLVLASAKVRASMEEETAAPKALELLKIAAEIRGLPPSRALALDQARYLALLNRSAEARVIRAKANTIPVVTPHDSYMLGCAYARYRTLPGYREAIRLLTNAINQSPNHYWSYFERALCHQELQERASGLSDLGTCIGLWPESSYAYFNRGYLLNLEGFKADAIADYTNAVRYDPSFDSAYLNRGLLRIELQMHSDALLDFQKVSELGRDDRVVAAGKAMALDGLGKPQELDLMIESLLKKPNWATDAATQRMAQALGSAISKRNPKLAAKIFDGILEIDPKHPQVLYGRGMLSMESKNLPQAVEAFNTAIGVDPKFIEPLRYRAVALARLGRFEQASADADECILQQPTNPDSWYIAACVAAISARRHKSDKLIAYAIEALKRAIEFGAEPERAVTDPDFSELNNVIEFQELVRRKPMPQHPRTPVST